MRTYRLIGFAVGLVLLLAGCAQQAQPPSDKPPLSVSNGTLEIVVQGVSQAGVEVVGTQGVVFSDTVNGSKTLSLASGSYNIGGKQVTGFINPSPATVVLDANQTTKTVLIYQTAPVASALVSKLEVTTVKDSLGQALPVQEEKNDNKPVMLYASQTEEPVCVTVKASDANGRPVSGAAIVVNVSELFGEHIAIIRGCSSGLLSAASFRDSLFTNDNGEAVFTLFATFGASLKNKADMMLLMNQPAKIVVAAENPNQTAVLSEFKFFFYNISHLYFNRVPTKTRLGATFAEINLFKPLNGYLDRGDPSANEFAVAASLFTKQPQQSLKLPNPLFDFKFELISGADKVHFVDCATLVNPSTCLDPDGKVKLEPNDNLGLRNLPIKASVKVTLYTQYRYGDSTYKFALKNFTVNKTWIGTYLDIVKTVDHHVLSWAGTGHTGYTLAAVNDPAIKAAGVFTSTISIKVKNQGDDPAYNVTISDALPAELGLLDGTAQPAGATYDKTSHVLTWNDQNTGLSVFNKLEPGQEISVSFQVYLRQKPGFCWDDDDYAKTATYQVKPIERCPTDPYQVVNGAALDDVTSTWYTGAAMPKGYQVKVDFNGAAFEKDVVIHGVRPVFALNKKLLDPPQPMDVGQMAYFELKISNPDRLPRYASLMSAYAAEFNGKVRDNPYGRDVTLSDVFDVGLDYVSASPLVTSDDEGITPAASYAPSFIADKGIKWANIPLLGGGDQGSARITLRANLPSPAAPSVLKTLNNSLDLNPGWYNCAFLDAKNLNQPKDYQGADWKQYEMRPWEAYPLHHKTLSELRYGLRDCVKLTVELKQEPWLELTTLGELGVGMPGGDQIGSIHQGNVYFHAMAVLNHGGATATDVSFNISLSGGRASFSSTPTDHQVYLWNGSSWNLVGTASSANATSVVFAPRNLSPNQVFNYIVMTKADLVGSADATGEATYSNAGIQLPFLPARVMENVQIQPKP